MKVIRLVDHEHCTDESACLVYEDKATLDHVYRVKAGYVVTFEANQQGYTRVAFAHTFPTKASAIDALNAYRNQDARCRG
jgi:hypothetical protein